MVYSMLGDERHQRIAVFEALSIMSLDSSGGALPCPK